MTMTSSVPDPTTGPKVNVALVQLRVAPPDDVPGQCKHMRELVLRAVEEGRACGQQPHIIMLGVSAMWTERRRR